jgi:CRP/FNR family transcriptional regulator
MDLSKVAVFSKLNEMDRQELVKRAWRRTFDKGEFICFQGDDWPNVMYLVSGKVAWTMLSPEGKRQVAFHLQSGDVAWGLTLFDSKPMPATLEVIEKSEVYQWSRDEILPIVSHSVDAVWEVSRVLASAMRRVREVVYGFAFQSVAGRLAHLLLDYYKPEEGEPTPRELTLDEMAAAVGTTRELVCKVLYRFADEDMIRINRTEFIFTNPDKLEAIAREG